MILEVLKNFFGEKTCTHARMDLSKSFGYCPDCGALIENQWYIVRCSCCGIKQKAIVKNGKVIPVENFCHNCGCHDYVVEKLDNIDFININYAALIRKETKPQAQKVVTQCWVESTRKTDVLPQLLPVFQ